MLAEAEQAYVKVDKPVEIAGENIDAGYDGHFRLRKSGAGRRWKLSLCRHDTRESCVWAHCELCSSYSHGPASALSGGTPARSRIEAHWRKCIMQDRDT